VIETAIGENNITTTIEGRRRFPVRVRYAPEFRRDPNEIANVLVTGSGGAQVPLGQLLRTFGRFPAAMINSENGLLEVSVLLNARGRDPGNVIADAEKAIRDKIEMLPATTTTGVASSKMKCAPKTPAGRLPVAIGVIYILLFLTYRSFSEAAHVLLAVPFALSGGLYLLWFLNYTFPSRSGWASSRSLYRRTNNRSHGDLPRRSSRTKSKRDGMLTIALLREAVMEGALLRLRPKLMTVSTVIAGLLPIFWSARVGSEVIAHLRPPFSEECSVLSPTF